jgi:hypothetical protein
MALGLLSWGSMTDVALSILALIAGGLTVELFGTGSLPLKSRAELGLNLAIAVPEVAEEFQSGNPS